jgi:predicted PurR-regulated permease PerM
MVQDEMILVAIEEIAKQLNEFKKSQSQQSPNIEIDISPLVQKISKIEERININSDSVIKYYKETQHISNSIRDIERILKDERQSIKHTYIEVKKPYLWIIGIISWFLLSFSLCFFFYQKNQKLKAETEYYKANDLKYRFLKLRSDKLTEISKYAKTTNEWIYIIDDYYQNNQKDVENYVLKGEEALKREFEAKKLAKQKASEAKEAMGKANDLKKKADGIGGN